MRDRNAVLLIALAGMAACNDDTPPIVEVFACSDYCPGPEEQYIKRVYEGVSDDEECQSLGGNLYTIEGWGKRVVCEVN